MRYRNIIRLVISSLSVVFMATFAFSQPQKTRGVTRVHEYPEGHVPPPPPHEHQRGEK